ncbi:MAG: hypothetical protein IT384_04770 [Deltaproteobacteria bacterium]|nr:hypothetical protein [Deltaproteobacteria bacterium]
MQNLVADDLTIELDRSTEGVIRLDWIGKSNARQPSQILGPFFDSVADQAAQSQSMIEMHFERMEHFNSSTITAVIRFIQHLRAQGVRLKIVFDGALKWQKLSFEALRIFEKPDGLLAFQAAGRGA